MTALNAVNTGVGSGIVAAVGAAAGGTVAGPFAHHAASGALGLANAKSASVTSFENAMQTGVIGGPRDSGVAAAPVGIAVDATTGTPLAQQAVASVNTEQSVSVAGDHILASLRQVSTDASHLWDNLTFMASGQTVMDLPRLLRLQTGALQASVQFDYLGKIITKAGQDIDSLVKTQ